MELTLASIVEELQRRDREGGVFTRFFNAPNSRELYPKHWEFFDAGGKYKQRMFRAGNRVGKTTTAGCELVYHLTGKYPPNWTGKKFSGSSQWWVCGKSAETVRQILQPLLLGKVGQFGTGLVPSALLDWTSLSEAKKAGVGVNTFRVLHTTGGFSQVEFKTYEQGRQAFEGTERSIWLDEEPPEDVYAECLTRTLTGDNILMLTFTPLKQISGVVKAFSRDGSWEPGEISRDKWVTVCTMYDVPHLSKDDIEEYLKSVPPYQREARSKGIPILGSGAIYPIGEDQLFEEPFEIPKHWKKAYGLDVGWNRTAAVWGAIDPESGTLHLYSEHYVGEAVPSTHAAAIRSRGTWINGVIDPASRGRTQDDGQQLLQNYLDLGLNLTTANNTVESALWDILEAMQQGRLKVFNTLVRFKEEFRGYARDDKGKVIKANDHLMDAFRYLWSSGRYVASTEKILNTTLNGLPSRKIAF